MMNPALRVALIGIDYFPYRSSSDKNYWLELVPLLRPHAHIEILSFNYRPQASEVQYIGALPVRIHNVKPAHLGVDLRPDVSSRHDPYKCHSHFKRQPRSLIEYTLSLLKIAPRARRLFGGHGPEIIHFMDNLGPAMRLFRALPSRPRLTVSAMGYYARGRWHDPYLRLSFAGMDAVVPYSRAYARKLSEIGLPGERIYPILWGVSLPKVSAAARADEMQAARRSLGLPLQARVVVWTGPIQQLGWAEFLVAHRVARQVRQRREDVVFAFLVKPEVEWPIHEFAAGEGIRVLRTSPEEFLAYRRAADLMLAPVTRLGSIVTPPLTWLEFMALGIPIVTNRAPGVEDVIADGVSGFVAIELTDLERVLSRALDAELSAVGRAARERIVRKYTVDRAAREYLALWQELTR